MTVLTQLDLLLDFSLFLLLVLYGQFVQVFALFLFDTFHGTCSGSPLRIPDRLIELFEFHRVPLRTLTVTVRVGHPVLYQSLVGPELLFKDQSYLLSEVSHDFLKFFGAHHLGGPFHLILTEFSWELSML